MAREPKSSCGFIEAVFSAGVAKQKTLISQIRSQFQAKLHIPVVATDYEISHGRDITWTLWPKQAPQHISESWARTSWIVEVADTGTRDNKPFHAVHLFLTSLRTTRWSVEGWH